MPYSAVNLANMLPAKQDRPSNLTAADGLELLRRAQTGDFAAFEELFSRLQGRVYGVAYRILGLAQDAEDVVQETFLSLIEHIDSFRGESAVATWLLRIATNFALKILRNKQGESNILFEGGDESFDTVPHPDYIAQCYETPDRLVERAELRDLLDWAIAELDDKCRVVFVLRDIEDLSTEETANALGLSISNVKVRLLRAWMQLRERLTREFGRRGDSGTTRPHPLSRVRTKLLNGSCNQRSSQRVNRRGDVGVNRL
jgi:RNA polymerase sigma-70 factor (ECF subfamily)